MRVARWTGCNGTTSTKAKMCPACYAALAWTVAGAVTAGSGVTLATVTLAKAKKEKSKIKIAT